MTYLKKKQKKLNQNFNQYKKKRYNVRKNSLKILHVVA